MFNEARKEIYDFRDFKTTGSFCKRIHEHGHDELNKSNEKQADLIQYIKEFDNKTRSSEKEDKVKNNDTFKGTINL